MDYIIIHIVIKAGGKLMAPDIGAALSKLRHAKNISQREAAQDLGANRWQSFWKVIVPLSMPGVYSGIVMVFMPTVSMFAIAELLTHNNIKLFGSLIQDYITTTDLLNYGAVLSLVLLIIIGLTSFFGDHDSKDEEKGGLV